MIPSTTVQSPFKQLPPDNDRWEILHRLKGSSTISTDQTSMNMMDAYARFNYLCNLGSYEYLELRRNGKTIALYEQKPKVTKLR